MKTVYVFLADGFEEIEAITPIDVLRRAEISVRTVGVTGKTVCGAHSIRVEADLDGANFVLPADASMVVLPGGGLGTENLGKSKVVANSLQQADERGIFIAAICAAPTILHEQGLLTGKRVTAFPTVQKSLTDSIVTGHTVEVDGSIITGRAAGVALEFSHSLIEVLLDKKSADEVTASLYP